ncbi:flagellar biosynthesis protein FlaG [Paenibacillus sp. 5J-6]|uniref:Flagellar biosynthesis protein FlaG n=1 Tax=Paenibacillus silvestris TaxID=2606219 RepID=A0A6L8V5W3_9BACL|nr:flagellar protein FlaG [Paenibacillus silvestris]MZQ85768.1 flagellar biosynthesis protein FlaG [Paenibacillus silvestris]
MEIQAVNENSALREKVTTTTGEKKVVEPKEHKIAVDKQQERVYSKDEVTKEVEGLNKWLDLKNSHLKFVLHDKLNEYYVQIVDDSSNEIVKEIPSKKVMDAVAAFRENLGIIVDKKI